MCIGRMIPRTLSNNDSSPMKMLRIEKKDLSGFLDKLKDVYRLYGPVRQEDMFSFVPIQDASEIDVSFQNSLVSPKHMFLAQSERMFEYTLDPSKDDAHVLKEVQKDHSPRAVIGIRPCDARAFRLVDVNFDTPEFQDPWWVRARDCTTLVGLGCTSPCSTCFCTSAGGGPFDVDGLDVLLTDTGDAFLAKILTEKGERLLELGKVFEPADEDLIQKASELKQEAEDKLISKVDTSRLADLNINDLYEAPFWESVHFACVNCGICTYLCPTCW